MLQCLEFMLFVIIIDQEKRVYCRFMVPNQKKKQIMNGITRQYFKIAKTNTKCLK